MRELRHEIEIDAPPAEVWGVLSDIGHYDWNPFIRAIDGTLAVGKKLRVRIAPPGGKGMTFRPTVLQVDEATGLRWIGHLLVTGLFDGEHSFELHELPGRRTRFVQRELFSGVLVSLSRSALDKTELGFAAMNEALKTRVEERNVAQTEAEVATA